MKSFACGDVVPGCDARFVCASEDEVLTLMARHANEVHGMAEVPADMVTLARSRMVTV